MNKEMSTNKGTTWEENILTETPTKSVNKIGFEAISSMRTIENDFVRKECKNIGKISGIYKIINRVNGKYYVGSALNIQKGYTSRWSKHKCYLHNNKHPNSHLQNAWNKYGEMAFDFIIVKEVPLVDLLTEEQSYLDDAEKDQANTYNLCFVAGRPNKLCDSSKKSKIEKLKHYYSNPSIKSEISQRNKGKHLFDEHKNILRSLIGIKNHRYGKKISSLEREKKLDQTIYTLKNEITQETFIGRRYDFTQKYKLNRGYVHKLVRGKPNVKSVKGWILKNFHFPVQTFS